MLLCLHVYTTQVLEQLQAGLANQVTYSHRCHQMNGISPIYGSQKHESPGVRVGCKYGALSGYTEATSIKIKTQVNCRQKKDLLIGLWEMWL